MKITEAGVVGALAGLMVPQMALRVTRGLFRLWLVLSVLWIGGVAFAARTVDGFSFIRAEIIKVTETSVSFRGRSSATAVSCPGPPDECTARERSAINWTPCLQRASMTMTRIAAGGSV